MAKTNFRQIINQDYLGAYSFDNQNGGYYEVDGIITRVEKRVITDQSGKSEKLVGITNIGKPIILRATNSTVLKEITGSRYIEDWVNVPVTFYVKLNVSSPQGLVDALRIKRQRVKVDYTQQINAIKACRTIEELQAVYGKLDKGAKVAAESAKDEMKLKLQPK